MFELLWMHSFVLSFYFHLDFFFYRSSDASVVVVLEVLWWLISVATLTHLGGGSLSWGIASGPWARLWDLVSNDDWSGSAQPTVGGSILRQVCLAYESRVAEMWAWEQDRKQLLSTAYFLPPGSFLPWAPALVLLVEDELWPTIPNKLFPPQSYFGSLCCYSNRKLTRTDILSFPFFYKMPLLFSLIIKVSTLFMLP